MADGTCLWREPLREEAVDTAAVQQAYGESLQEKKRSTPLEYNNQQHTTHETLAYTNPDDRQHTQRQTNKQASMQAAHRQTGRQVNDHTHDKIHSWDVVSEMCSCICFRGPDSVHRLSRHLRISMPYHGAFLTRPHAKVPQ
jgi:hypothetical protein